MNFKKCRVQRKNEKYWKGHKNFVNEYKGLFDIIGITEQVIEQSKSLEISMLEEDWKFYKKQTMVYVKPGYRWFDFVSNDRLLEETSMTNISKLILV